MARTRFSIFAGLLFLSTAVACSENPNEVKQLGPGRSTVITPTGTLDHSIGTVLALFPKGLGNAATTRWDNVKRKYEAGLTNPSQMKVAKQMLVELSDWVIKKAPEMASPPDNETKTAASTRAVLYMSMYVYGGPATSPPPFIPTADAIVGIVTPGAPATIVTPTTHAGVQFEAGSVDENTVVVVTQNPNPYSANCSGPLQTKLCQYPQFYTFDQFPHKRLLKPAKFAVCHVNAGDERYPLADHDRFRLAHSKPADPASYTPGSTIRDQNGESIEILPLVTQTFSTCEDNHYHSAMGPAPGGLTGFLARLAQGVKKIATPKTAYAIDVGLGGLGFEMSPFNVVDPQSVPDLAVQSFGAGPLCGPSDCVMRPGGRLGVGYSIRNHGTAASGVVTAVIRIVSVPSNPEDPGIPTDILLGSFNIPAMVPGASIEDSNANFVIPSTLAAGPYTVKLVVGGEPTFPEPATTMADNVGTHPLNVAPAADSRPAIVRVCATSLSEGPPTVAGLGTAIASVRSGGTIRICDGTYMIGSIDLNVKSMTIEGEGPGVPILDAGSEAQIFYMDSPTPVNTSVTLRRLRLQGGTFGQIAVLHNHGALLIDQVEFHPPHGVAPNPDRPALAYSSGIGVFDARGLPGVRVQNSTFIGGDIGVHTNNASNVVVVNSEFRNQLNAAIHGGNGGDLVVDHNTISNCGVEWCMGIFNNAVMGTFKILNNTFVAGFTGAAMQLHHSNYEVRGNTIIGVGGSRNPELPTTWPINNAIFINDTSTVIISDNRISGAYVAFHILNATNASGTNNTVSDVSQGMRVFLTNGVVISRSDFTNYTTALDTNSEVGIAACNWWGTPAGPQGVAPWISPVTYANWARAPIANQPDVGCGP